MECIASNKQDKVTMFVYSSVLYVCECIHESAIIRQLLQSCSVLPSKKEGPRKVRCTITVLGGRGAPSMRVSALASTRTAARNAAARNILRKIKKNQCS